MKDDAISRREAIRIASGFCHPANVAKELAKLPAVQTCEDAVSRAAAIDEAEEWIEVVYCEDGDQRERDAIGHVIHGIKELPSVQTCEDAVSRQAAIDALAKFVPYVIDDVSTESYTNGLTDAYNLICRLPSAQPEIIRCKNCKWCEDADGLMCKNPASWVVATDRDFGCVLAERREHGSD